MRHYYFGCVDIAGHHLWTTMSGGQLTSLKTRLPAELGNISIDGQFMPVTHKQNDRYLWIVDTPESRWTIISFIDNTVDNRPGSHSTFIFEGAVYDCDVNIFIEKHYPMIYKRMGLNE